MIIRISAAALIKCYLLLAVTYYLGYWTFLFNLLQGRGGGDNFSENAGGSIEKQVLGLLLLAGGLYLLARFSTGGGRRILVLGFWWLLLIAWFAASIFWSYEPGISLRRVMAFATMVVVAYCLAEFFELEGLLLLFAQAIAIAACLGLVYAVIEPGRAFLAEGGRQNAFLGIFSDKNAGARFYAYAGILLLGLGNSRRRLDVGAFVVCMFCLLISQSVSGLAMVVAGGGLAVACRVLHSRFQRVSLRRLVVLTLLLAAATVAISFLYAFLLEMVGRDPTLTNRALIWELLDPYVEREYWFGYGFGAFWASSAVLEFVERWGFIGNAHSGYYEAMLHGGIVCLGLVFLIMAKVLKDSALAYVKHPQGALFAPILAIILVQAAVNYVGFVVLNHNSFDMLLFVVIYFLAAKYARIAQRRSHASKQPPLLQSERSTAGWTLR